MASIAELSPYAYLATICFTLSAISSDLLFIRMSLTGGFFWLILGSVSGYSVDGSFSYMPLSDGIVDITLLVNIALCCLNLYVCIQLVNDERPQGKLNDEEMALFRFFHSRSGVTPLQFQSILKNGSFVELPADSDVPRCGSSLYLVLEGIVLCETRLDSEEPVIKLVKRSGEFFDIKLFNLFSLPIGFDGFPDFKARTKVPSKLFCWNVHSLIAMRKAHSPSLREYWEYMVLRSLSSEAYKHYLKPDETQYDSQLVPEHKSWLDGAPSRDFWREEKPIWTWEHWVRQCTIIRSSLMNIIPPRGVRQRPGMGYFENPKLAYIEMLCKNAAAQENQTVSFRFLREQSEPESERSTGEVEAPPSNLFNFRQSRETDSA